MAGSRKGVKNKNPNQKRFQRALVYLMDDVSDELPKWLARVAEDDPKGAIDCIVKLADFIMPKIQRIEHTGKDGEALTIKNILEAIETPAIPTNPAIESGDVIDVIEYDAIMDHGLIDIKSE